MSTESTRNSPTHSFVLPWTAANFLTIVNRPLAWLDLTRILAALAIVWIHCPQSSDLLRTTLLARFAVPFFIATSVFLVFQSVDRDPRRSWIRYSGSRIQRLYFPFLVWSGAYLAFKWVKGWLLPDQPNDFPGWEWWIVGGAYHLWFLPFLLAVSLLSFAVAKASARSNRTRDGFALAGLLSGCVAAAWAPSAWPSGPYESFYFMLAALPAVFWAWPAAWLYRRWISGDPVASRGCVSNPASSRKHFGQADPAARPLVPVSERTAISVKARPGNGPSAAARGVADAPRAALFFACGLILFTLCSCELWRNGRNIWLENTAGMAILMCACVPLAPRFATRLRGLAELSFGIYLSHLLIVKLVEAGFHQLGCASTSFTDVATWTIAVAGAMIISGLLRKFPATRWLI